MMWFYGRTTEVTITLVPPTGRMGTSMLAAAPCGGIAEMHQVESSPRQQTAIIAGINGISLNMQLCLRAMDAHVCCIFIPILNCFPVIFHSFRLTNARSLTSVSCLDPLVTSMCGTMCWIDLQVPHM